jgi:hypothetical protein
MIHVSETITWGGILMTIKEKLDGYNVIYTVPGRSDRSAMPLGNGRTGISLWVEQDGELQFYIGHTDAQSEMDRNVKLGKVSLRLEPNPFVGNRPFSQELCLNEGCIRIQAGGEGDRVALHAFVEAGSDAIHVTVESSLPVSATARVHNWRTAPRAPWGIPDPSDVNGGVIMETADVVQERDGGVLFYHRNGNACVQATAKVEGLDAWMDCIPDTLENRTFGGFLTLAGGIPSGAGSVLAAPGKHHHLAVSVFCGQTERTETLLASVVDHHLSVMHSPGLAGTARERTASHWTDYFSSSWMFVRGDPALQAAVPDEIARVCLEPDEVNEAPSSVTRSYVLTKFMFACSAGGKIPMYFNGLIFNLMPGLNRHLAFEGYCQTFAAQPVGEPTLEINPDEKGWESCINLWQNVRLLYAPMLARGEFDSVRRLFAYYLSFQDINRVKAKVYYGAEGQYNTEMTNTFGLMPVSVYGSDRSGLADGYAVNRWGGAIDISPGLELCFMMLDWYAHTDDDAWLVQHILPFTEDLLRYVETRFRERKNGKLVLSPLQSVETYFETTNPIPVVAGLHAVVGCVLALPVDKVPNRTFFERYHDQLPALPMEAGPDGAPVLAPADAYVEKRMNVESPEFYAVYPFRLFTHEKGSQSLIEQTWRTVNRKTGCFQPHRFENPPGKPCYSGWQYHGMVAALLGHADEAAEILVNNCALKNPGTRFPAMWGPVYDAVPDGDHGGNLTNTLQLMALQSEGDRIHLLPAWPESWDVDFKLHANHGTTVACVFRDGVVRRLEVSPPERMADVVAHRRMAPGTDRMEGADGI